MKKVLPFAGLIAFVLALVAFILMLATNGVVVTSGSYQLNYAGTTVIFGNKESTLLGTLVTKGSVLAIIGFILLIVGLLAALAGVIGSFLKVKAIAKFVGALNLVAAVCFLVAGIFMFLAVPTFYGANDVDVPKGAALGAGWVIGAILSILAAVAAALPAGMGLLSKK